MVTEQEKNGVAEIKTNFQLSENPQLIPKLTGSEDVYEANSFCVTAWNINDKLQWFIGCFKENLKNGRYIVDHLERLTHDNVYWKYPDPEDIQEVTAEQILPCSVDGEWDISEDDQMEFTLRNAGAIKRVFQALTK